MKKGIILAILASIFWGIMGIFVRNLSALGFSYIQMAFLRCFLAGIGFLILNLTFNKSALRINKKGIFIAISYGFIAYSISFITYNIAIERLSIGVATVLMFMSPIWVSILGKFIFKDILRPFKWCMIGVTIIGGVLVSNIIFHGNGSFDLFGVLAGITNGFGVALQIMVPRYFKDKYESEALLCYGFLGAAFLLAFCSDLPTMYYLIVPFKANVILNILILGGLCTFMANGFYVKSSQIIGTSATSMLVALEIVVASVAGYLCYAETFNIPQYIGCILIIIGIIFFERKGDTEAKIDTIAA